MIQGTDCGGEFRRRACLKPPSGHPRLHLSSKWIVCLAPTAPAGCISNSCQWSIIGVEYVFTVVLTDQVTFWRGPQCENRSPRQSAKQHRMEDPRTPQRTGQREFLGKMSGFQGAKSLSDRSYQITGHIWVIPVSSKVVDQLSTLGRYALPSSAAAFMQMQLQMPGSVPEGPQSLGGSAGRRSGRRSGKFWEIGRFPRPEKRTGRLDSELNRACTGRILDERRTDSSARWQIVRF